MVQCPVLVPLSVMDSMTGPNSAKTLETLHQTVSNKILQTIQTITTFPSCIQISGNLVKVSPISRYVVSIAIFSLNLVIIGVQCGGAAPGKDVTILSL